MNPHPQKHPTRPKAWRTPTVTLAVACLCATALAAPPGLGLPDMPPEKPGPTAAEREAQKRLAQREADQAKADKAAAETRAKKEQQAREAAEAKTRELEKRLADAEAKARAAEAAAKAAREAQDKAQTAATQAVKVVTSTPPAPAPIPDFTRLPSVAGGPVFIALPLQSFQMGSTNGDPDEKPPHPVRVSQRIAMGEMEVTTAQYMACASDTSKGKPLCDQPEWNETGNKYNLQTGSNKYYQRFVADNQPIVGVSWHNARQYAEWLSRETGHSYKLPTEAQWEFACRAGGTHTYCGSNDANAVAWYGDNSGSQAHPVGNQNKKNAWGLFDMSGNAWEWVADCYNDKEYPRRKGQGEEWPAHQTSHNSDDPRTNCSRVLRGGSWVSDADSVRSADRSSSTPGFRGDYIGFRLSRTLP